MDDLRHLLAFLDCKQRIHRFDAHLERTLADQCIGVTLAEELKLHLEGVGRDERELAGVDVLLALAGERLEASGANIGQPPTG